VGGRPPPVVPCQRPFVVVPSIRRLPVVCMSSSVPPCRVLSCRLLASAGVCPVVCRPASSVQRRLVNLSSSCSCFAFAPSFCTFPVSLFTLAKSLSLLCVSACFLARSNPHFSCPDFTVIDVFLARLFFFFLLTVTKLALTETQCCETLVKINVDNSQRRAIVLAIGSATEPQ